MSTSKLTIGTAGFVVLDVCEPYRDRSPVNLHFGGTAGNVAAILAGLGWCAYPFARLPEDDPAFWAVAADMACIGLRNDFVSLNPQTQFPTLVQRKRANGSPQPLFTLRCPRCNQRWRGWSSITEKTAKEIASRLPICDVFFIDRFTPGNLALAAAAKSQGARIAFEPAALNLTKAPEVKRFKEALALADILKYSAQQFAQIDDEQFPRHCPLEIQTRGDRGLRFRHRTSGDKVPQWIEIPACKIDVVVDPCGAGDWLTATLIHLIGRDKIGQLPEERIRELILASQSAAVWNCGYPAARGGQYALNGTSENDLADFVHRQTGKEYSLRLKIVETIQKRDVTLPDAMLEFCPICRGDWLKAATPSSSDAHGTWTLADRPGFAGRKAGIMQQVFNKQYGPGNWQIVYRWQKEAISRNQALELYVEAYEAYLRDHANILDWLTRTARDVYDIDPSDVESGTDFSIQQNKATHLQDIAVRIAVGRLGRKFEGTELVQIRGKSSQGSMLSPGVVPFHQPGEIEQPEIRGWWQPGSIESFWQSNKFLQVRTWESRLFVFGGSFNPIHNGHLHLARLAREAWGFDQVLFVPNGDNYRKKSLSAAPAQIRLEIVRATIEGEAGMDVTDVEVRDPVPMRTPVTMREICERHPQAQVALYRGLDSLHRTHRDCFLLPNLFVLAVDRPGWDLTLQGVLARHRKFDLVRDRFIYVRDAEPLEISSTQVREAVAQGLSITDMVPAQAAEIIKSRGLYET